MFQNKAHYAALIKIAQHERDESLEWARGEAAQIGDDEKNKIAAMDFRTLRGERFSYVLCEIGGINYLFRIPTVWKG